MLSLSVGFDPFQGRLI